MHNNSEVPKINWLATQDINRDLRKNLSPNPTFKNWLATPAHALSIDQSILPQEADFTGMECTIGFTKQGSENGGTAAGITQDVDDWNHVLKVPSIEAAPMLREVRRATRVASRTCTASVIGVPTPTD
jgi:hypothetical protein